MYPRLVVFGLGNPGSRYANTRHNLGFRVVDRMAAAGRVQRWQTAQTYVAARADLGSTRIDLVKPRTFMNRSGGAVRACRRNRNVEPGEMLVVVDDIALTLGQLRLRRRGSDGGHNGLRSVIAALGTTEFARLRLGVGPVPAGIDPAEFVLGSFAAGEEGTVDAMVARAVCCVDTIVRRGFDHAMGVFNAPEKRNGETG